MKVGQDREEPVHAVDFHVGAERIDIRQDVALSQLHDLGIFFAAACEQNHCRLF